MKSRSWQGSSKRKKASNTRRQHRSGSLERAPYVVQFINWATAVATGYVARQTQRAKPLTVAPQNSQRVNVAKLALEISQQRFWAGSHPAGFFDHVAWFIQPAMALQVLRQPSGRR